MPRELNGDFFGNLPQPTREFDESRTDDWGPPEVVLNSGFSKAAVEWMTNRTAMFQSITQGKNKPMTYGKGKKE